ncbi:MAG: extracellular solute-binding protein [Bacillota bacterium]
MKKILLISILIISILVIGCSNSESEEVTPNSEITTKQWNRLVDSSNETIVNVVYYTDNEKELISWLKKDFTKDVKLRYNISLRFTFKDFDKLKNSLIENLKEDENTIYDLIFISQKGFKTLKNNELLYQKTLLNLPNYYKNLQGEKYITEYLEGIKIENQAVPVFKNQLIFIHNEDDIYETPKSFDEFLDFAKEYEKKVSYIHPKNEVGMAFILSAISSKVDVDEINKLSANKDEVYEKIKPGLDYLIELDKYLYKDGEKYIESTEKMDELFLKDTLIFSMSMDNNHVTEQIAKTLFPKSSNSFVIQEGTTGFASYFTIPKMSDNKAGAFVVLNDLISGETQSDFYSDINIDKIPVLNIETMPTKELSHLKNAKVKYTSVRNEDLYQAYVPEIRPEIRDIIYELWSEYVE